MRRLDAEFLSSQRRFLDRGDTVGIGLSW